MKAAAAHPGAAANQPVAGGGFGGRFSSTRVRAALLALVMALVLIAASWEVLRWREERALASWGLPSDLRSWQAQLETLGLPPGVKSIGWVSGSIKHLIANGTAIDCLDHLSANLEELDISNTTVRILPDLPPGLRSIDLRWSSINDYADRLANSNLRSLKLGGRELKSLPEFPPALEELELADTGLHDAIGLPSSIRRLTLAGASFKDLSGLPSELKALTLSATSVRSLQGLPHTLQWLEVNSNSDLELDPLPPFLSRLSVRKQQIKDLAGLRFLTSVSFRKDDDDATAFPAWPASLRTLTLEGNEAAAAPQMPDELTSLDLSLYRSTPAGPVPARLHRLVIAVAAAATARTGSSSLEELEVSGDGMTSFNNVQHGKARALFACDPGREAMGPFPASLLQLEICPSAALKKIMGLPPRLQRLKLAGTGLESKGLADLPNSLRALDISNTKIGSLAELRLKEGLLTLTLSAGQIETLEGLPASVRTLLFVESSKVVPAS